MLKEDNILNSRFGKKNHFQVPAGYFDQLTDRVMANLPEQEPRIIHMQMMDNETIYASLIAEN